MSVDSKFIRDIDQYFKYPTDENPTTQQQYQEAVRNWVTTEEAIVDSHLWQPTTSYSVGNQVRTPSLPPQYVLVCTTAGVSGSGEPDYENVGVGDSVTDGTAEWLVSEALTSAGGTMGGNIEWNGINDDTFAIGMSDSNNDNVDVGWKYTDKKGAGIGLRNISHNDGGVFNIWATNGTNISTLVGKPDGTLSWSGQFVKNGIFVKAASNSSYTQYFGGTDNTSANIVIYGKNHSSQPGRITIRANNGTNETALSLQPNGYISWGGLDISPQVLSTVAFNDKNVATGTRTSIGSFTLTKGTWLIVASVSFESNSTGYRYVGISDTSTGNQINRFASVLQAAPTGTAHIVFTTMHNVSSNTTLYLTAHQTSGSTLSTSNNGVRLFRLSHDA